MKKLREKQRRLTYKGEVRFRVIDNKRVELLPPAMTLEATFASVKPKRRPLDFKKMRDTAIDKHVGNVARKQFFAQLLY